jgi:hypothetical protein
MHGYNKSDITVTYDILFFVTVVMELAPIFMSILCNPLVQCNLLSHVIIWEGMVSQHNIMSFCVRKKKPPTLMKLATFNYLRDYINKHWYIHLARARSTTDLDAGSSARRRRWVEGVHTLRIHVRKIQQSQGRAHSDEGEAPPPAGTRKAGVDLQSTI